MAAALSSVWGRSSVRAAAGAARSLAGSPAALSSSPAALSSSPAALSSSPAAAPSESPAGRMQAWRLHAYGAVSELRLEAARVPALRHPADLLVRVATSSINPIDVAMIGGYGARAFNTLRALEGDAGVEFPLVPGRDLCGIVVRAGPHARLRPGQRVWAALPPHWPGAHAQLALVRDEWAGPAPDTLSDEQAGGALYAALTAAAAVRAAGRAARVLLLGLGGVGQAALQLLGQRGAAVTVGCAPELTELALRYGAAEALDRHAEEYEARLAAGAPYDAVLDCAGLGGAAAGRWACSRYVTLSPPLLREMDARGVAAGALAAGATLLTQSSGMAAGRGGCAVPHVRWAFFSVSRSDVEQLRRLAERGALHVCVERAWAWREALAAYERAAEGGARGKLLLDFRAC